MPSRSEELRRAIALWGRWAALHGERRRELILGVAALLAQAVTIVSVPVVVQALFARLGDGDSVWLTVGGGVVVGVLYLASGAFAYLGRHALVLVCNTAGERLREQVVARVLSLSPRTLDRMDAARLETVAVEDIERATERGSAVLAAGAPSAVMCAVLGVAMLVLDPHLTLLTASAVPVLWWAERRLGPGVRTGIDAYHSAHAAFNHRYATVLRALPFVRAHAAEDDEAHLHRELARTVRDERTRAAIAAAAFDVAQSTAVHAISAVVLVVGGLTVATGTSTLGDLLAFYVTLMLAKNYAMILMSAFPSVIVGSSALESVFSVIDLGEEEPYTGEKRIEFGGSLGANGVTFAYENTEILSEASIAIAPGETVAVCGPNGSGKSTLIALLLGLERPSRGSLTADGISYEELDMRSLRRGIGYVPQEPVLFVGTVRENLCYGSRIKDESDNATVDQLLQDSLRTATADSVVAKLSAGLDADIGEHGLHLSGGERQRLSIARALVGKPRLLILDEPGNHLDRVSIEKLVANLLGLNPRPAVLVVTHDRALLEMADRVYDLAPLDEARAAGQPQLALRQD